MVKKGAFFSLDALIAVMILLMALATITYVQTKGFDQPQTSYYASDLVEILSSVKLEELPTEIVENYSLEKLNRTIMEQVLRWEVEGNSAGEDLLDSILEGVVPPPYEVGVWMEEVNAVYSSGSGNGEELFSAKRMISGLERERDVDGTAARALLSNIDERTSSEYAYFGGYEGDGNVTKIVSLPSGSYDEMEIEMNAGGNFDLYINNNFVGSYSGSSGYDADTWLFSGVELTYLQTGDNEFKFIFTGDRKFVGGGFVKVDYTTSELSLDNYDGENKYYFPGLEGIINLYSSFYVPGNLLDMNISLHFESDVELFLAIGNQTVFTSNSSGEVTVNLDDGMLNGILDYTELGEKTIPLRFGLVNVSYQELGQGGLADAVLVTDVSGSMDGCAEYSSPLMCRYSCLIGGSKSCTVSEEGDCTGNVCGGSCFISFGHELDCGNTLLDVAKIADKEFVDVVLNISGNNVGLVSYSSSTQSTESLTNDSAVLDNEIDNYNANGGTCICCGVLSATSMLDSESDSERYKSMLVMTDGEANAACGMDPVSDHDLDGDTTDDPQDHAIQAACDAYTDSNITVYTVGFGDLGVEEQDTLQKMADCGNGMYIHSNISNLTQVYTIIAQEIINLSYSSQTVVGKGGYTKLFEDSYIDFGYNYSGPTQEFGRIPVTAMTARFGNNITEGRFYIPENMEVYEAKITSYSGEMWTHYAAIEDSGWDVFYELSDYGSDYHKLGDAYAVNVPVSLLSQENNLFRIMNGYNPINSTGGSIDDRLIYTAGIEIKNNFTGIFDEAEGCIWTITFEDDNNVSLPLPSDYNGSKECMFDNSTDCNLFTDAIDNAVCKLFEQLDLDGNGKLFIKFGPGDVEIETSSIERVPYLWGPSTVEVRVWR